jgi:hypothetical protein
MKNFIVVVFVLTLSGLLFYDPVTAITLLMMAGFFGIIGLMVYPAVEDIVERRMR